MIVISLLCIASSLVLLMIANNYFMFNLPAAFVASLVALLFAGGAQILRVSIFQESKENKTVKYIGLFIILVILGFVGYYYAAMWESKDFSSIWGRLFLIWMAVEALFILFIQLKGDSVDHEDTKHAEL